MKRVLMIAYHFPPIRGSSGVHRTLQFARHLPKNGWEGLVVSVSPRAYPMVAEDLLGDIPSGLVVRRALALDSARHLSLRGRYLGLTAIPDRWVSWWPAGALTCLQLIRAYRPNAVWSTFPIATAHLIGLTVRKLTRLPWVADFRDPMVQESHRLPPLARGIWRGLERAVVRNASRCVVATNGMMSDFAVRFPEANPASCSVIENGYEEELFAKAERDGTQFRTEHKGSVRLLHSGILYGDGRNPAFFFEALKQVVRERCESVEVVLRGSGAPETYERTAAEFGLSRIVKVLQFIGYREAVGEMLHADGLIIFQGSVFNKQIPAKAYEYIRSGRPILALTDPAGDTAKLLARWDGVYSAGAESVPEIKTALFRLLDDLANGKIPIRSNDDVLLLSRSARTAGLAAVLDGVVAP